MLNRIAMIRVQSISANLPYHYNKKITFTNHSNVLPVRHSSRRQSSHKDSSHVRRRRKFNQEVPAADQVKLNTHKQHNHAAVQAVIKLSNNTSLWTWKHSSSVVYSVLHTWHTHPARYGSTNDESYSNPHHVLHHLLPDQRGLYTILEIEID